MGCHHGLVEEVFGRAVRRGAATVWRGSEVEAGDSLAPSPWHLGEQSNPKARILRAFGVVCRRGQQRQRMAPGSLSARFVKLVETAGALRVGTDVVERDEADEAVEGRVLHPLAHPRAPN